MPFVKKLVVPRTHVVSMPSFLCSSAFKILFLVDEPLRVETGVSDSHGSFGLRVLPHIIQWVLILNFLVLDAWDRVNFIAWCFGMYLVNLILHYIKLICF